MRFRPKICVEDFGDDLGADLGEDLGEELSEDLGEDLGEELENFRWGCRRTIRAKIWVKI